MDSKKKIYPFVVVSCIFFFSRICAFLAGVRFDARFEAAIQIIDPILLKNNLFESVFYLHSQPPLYNLFVGTILKLFPTCHIIVFSLIYLVTGFLIAIGMLTLLQRFKVPEWLATAFTCFYIINPAVILLENWGMYTYFIIALLIWSAVFLHQYLSGGKRIDGFIFFFLLSILVLTKSIFHIIWFILLVVVVVVLNRTGSRRTLILCFLPFMLIFSVYLKNYMLFGSFTTSKIWMAYNLTEMVVKNIPQIELTRLYKEGKISIFSAREAFDEALINDPGVIDAYRKQFAQIEKSGIPILDQVKKPTTGRTNWFSREQLWLTDFYLKDNPYLLKHYPKSFLKSLIRAYLISFFPASTDSTHLNRQYIRDYENIYNFMFAHLNQLNNGRLYDDKLLLWYRFDTIEWDDLSLNLYLIVICFYVALFVLGLYMCGHSVRNLNENKAFAGTLFFMLFNIFYITAGSNVFAWIGSNRYRFGIESFFLTIFAILLTRFLPEWRKKERAKILA